MKQLLPLVILFLTSLFQVQAQVSFAETLGYDPPAGQAADTIVLVGNSAAFYNTPHLLPVSDPQHMPLSPLTNSHEGSDWKVFFVLAGLTALAIARYLFGTRIRHFFKAAFGSGFFNLMEREGGFFNEWVTYLLFFNFLVAFSLLIWQTIRFFGLSPTPDLINPLLLFFLIMVMASLFTLGKSILLGFIAWVFKTKTATNAYVKNIFLFNQLTGLILLPAVVYLTYSPSSYAMLFIWSFWMLANLVKLTRGFVICYSHTSFSAYYLILYLCSVELVPFALIIKLGSIYLNTT